MVVGLGRAELLERRSGWGMGGRASITLHLEAVDGRDMTDLVRGTVPGLPLAAVQGSRNAPRGCRCSRSRPSGCWWTKAAWSATASGSVSADPDAPFAVPPSLQALIAARLDGLDAEERLLLLDASVLGRSFPTPGTRGGPRER